MFKNKPKMTYSRDAFIRDKRESLERETLETSKRQEIELYQMAKYR